MHALIMTLLAIALTSAFVMSSLSYLPAWQGAAQTSAELTQVGFSRLERAFDVYAQANGDTPAAPTAAADGGLVANFSTLLGFVPRAPDGYAWSYGQRPVDGGTYSGMHYFCLAPLSASAGNEGVVRGIVRLRQVVPQDQVVFSDACGAVADWSAPADYPQALHATYYVVYVAGMN